jgi:hypothetical protein
MLRCALGFVLAFALAVSAEAASTNCKDLLVPGPFPAFRAYHCTMTRADGSNFSFDMSTTDRPLSVLPTFRMAAGDVYICACDNKGAIKDAKGVGKFFQATSFTCFRGVSDPAGELIPGGEVIQGNVTAGGKKIANLSWLSTSGASATDVSAGSCTFTFEG